MKKKLILTKDEVVLLKHLAERKSFTLGKALRWLIFSEALRQGILPTEAQLAEEEVHDDHK